MQVLGITWRKVVANVRTSTPMSQLRRLIKVAFSDKFLFYTNITVSLSLSSVGDLMEQSYEIYTKEQDSYDGNRCAIMAFSGAAAGVLCHNWYKILDRFIVGKTIDMVIKKLVLDQMVFSPIMIITFFGSVALFEEQPVENFKVEVKDKFVTLYRAEWMVWPPAQVINFYYLPTRYRVLYDNTISLGYDVYTSQVKHSKTPKHNGAAHSTNGTAHLSNGAENSSNGTVHTTNGTIHMTNGTIHTTNGTIHTTNEAKHTTNNVHTSNGATQSTNGTKPS